CLNDRSVLAHAGVGGRADPKQLRDERQRHQRIEVHVQPVERPAQPRRDAGFPLLRRELAFATCDGAGGSFEWSGNGRRRFHSFSSLSSGVTGSIQIQQIAPRKYMIEEMRNVRCQSRPVYSSTLPTTYGPATPPRLPIMFMLPDIVPAYLPPTSMHVLQLPGMVRSLQKLAIPIASIASRASLM